MTTDRDLLMRYLEGALDQATTARLEEQLRASDAEGEALRAQLDRLRTLRGALPAARSDSFAPYFSDRVMKRLVPQHAAVKMDSFYASLRMGFARTAIACLLAAGALAAYNFVEYGGSDVTSSVPEALFGLPSASLVDALSYETF